MSQILVLLVPLWINAFDYMLLTRMVHFFGPSRPLFRIRASTLAPIFVSLDSVSFVIRLIGENLTGPGASPAEQLKGIHVYMGRNWGAGILHCWVCEFWW